MTKRNSSPHTRADTDEENNTAEKSKFSNVQLSELLDKNDLRAKAVRALNKALTAERNYWDGVAKVMRSEPDHKTRASAAVDILCFTDGKPIERKEIVTVTLDSLEALQKKAEQSPALRQALQKILNETGNTMPDSVKPVSEATEKPPL